jgi:ribonuclease VapC
VTALVVDTSAMVAIVTNEPESEWLAGELAKASERIIPAPVAVELGIVLEARTPTAAGVGRRVLQDAGVRVMPFDERLAEHAVDAWRRFGKGRHRAALNFGDCCVYALAEATSYPILCTGGDFALTDLPVHRPLRRGGRGTG